MAPRGGSPPQGLDEANRFAKSITRCRLSNFHLPCRIIIPNEKTHWHVCLAPGDLPQACHNVYCNKCLVRLLFAVTSSQWTVSVIGNHESKWQYFVSLVEKNWQVEALFILFRSQKNLEKKQSNWISVAVWFELCNNNRSICQVSHPWASSGRLPLKTVYRRLPLLITSKTYFQAKEERVSSEIMATALSKPLLMRNQAGNNNYRPTAMTR